MTCEFQVREMALQDIDPVLVMERLCFATPWSREAFIGEVRDNECAHYLVGETAGRVVAYGGFWRVLDEGHITNVAVHPDYQDLGYGKILLGALLRRAAELGVVSATLEVRESNFRAIRLYEKFGFEPAGRRKGYYADNGEDAIIMWQRDLENIP